MVTGTIYIGHFSTQSRMQALEPGIGLNGAMIKDFPSKLNFFVHNTELLRDMHAPARVLASTKYHRISTRQGHRLQTNTVRAPKSKDQYSLCPSESLEWLRPILGVFDRLEKSARYLCNQTLTFPNNVASVPRRYDKKNTRLALPSSHKI